MVLCRRAEHHTGPAVVLNSRGSTREADRITDHSRGWRRIAIPGERPRPLLELVVIAAIFGAYKLGRIVAAKHVGTAFDNAYVVWDLERLLRLPDELSVQALMLHSAVVVKIANVYYAAVHFPATAAFLVWLYLRRPDDYLWIRRTLALLTASGLLVHLAIPVTPPRMLSTLGFVDTAAVYGPAVYGPPAQNTLADQYAAMPSLHIGWAVMVALGITVTTRSRWRWLAVLHPVVTTLVVIGTANHFWLDGMVAAGLLAASLVVVRSITEPRVDVPDFVPVLTVRPLPAVAGRAVAGLPDRMPPPQRRARPEPTLPTAGPSRVGSLARPDLPEPDAVPSRVARPTDPAAPAAVPSLVARPAAPGAVPSRVRSLGWKDLSNRTPPRRVASRAGSADRPQRRPRSRRVLNPAVLLGMPLGIVTPVVLDFRARAVDRPGSAAAAEDLADVSGDRRDR